MLIKKIPFVIHTGLICVCPLILTLSATTLTSQNKVNLSSGNNPLASSIKKSRRINFLNPQSFPLEKKQNLFTYEKNQQNKNIYLEQIDKHVEIP
jgi:hypothetical protein